MPDAAQTPCRHPGCGVIGRCPVHERQQREDRPEWDGWYRIARWRNPVWGLRTRCLRASPLCVDCRKEGRVVPATEVDHIVPHHGDPALFWNIDNLQALCYTHHARKTARGL